MASEEMNPRTGQCYYAESIQGIQEVCSILDLDTGRASKIDPETVHRYMNDIEMAIDDMLEEVYFTPIRKYNTIMPDEHVERQFPGEVRRLAKNWTAGVMLRNEFQGLSQNQTDQINQLIEDARKGIFQMTVFSHRIPGQKMKSTWGRTCPPSMQPALPPTENW